MIKTTREICELKVHEHFHSKREFNEFLSLTWYDKFEIEKCNELLLKRDQMIERIRLVANIDSQELSEIERQLISLIQHSKQRGNKE